MRAAETRNFRAGKGTQRGHGDELAQPRAADFRHIWAVVVQRYPYQLGPSIAPFQYAQTDFRACVLFELCQQSAHFLNEVCAVIHDGEFQHANLPI